MELDQERTLCRQCIKNCIRVLDIREIFLFVTPLNIVVVAVVVVVDDEELNVILSLFPFLFVPRVHFVIQCTLIPKKHSV